MSKKTVFAFSILALTACFLSYKVGSTPTAHAATLPPPPAEWVLSDFSETAGVDASVTRPAVAGVQHVADCVSFSSYTTGTSIFGHIALLDGTTTLMFWTVPQANTASGSSGVSVCGLNVVGSVGNSMTLQYQSGTANPNAQSVNLVGHDAT